MKIIFVTSFYRTRAGDYYGFSMAEDGELLAEDVARDQFWIRYQLGMEGSNYHHARYKEKYPEGYILKFIHQFEFDEHKDFKEARIRSLHVYANSSV